MSNINIDSGVLESVVQYMQGADAIMSKQASMDDALATKGASTIEGLVEAKLLPEAIKEASIEKIKEDPTYMIDLLEKVSSVMQADTSAGVGVDNIKSASTELSADDAFVRALLG